MQDQNIKYRHSWYQSHTWTNRKSTLTKLSQTGHADMPSPLRTIEIKFPSASRCVRAMNSDADSAATDNVPVGLDSATNSAAIKFFGNVFAFLLPEDKHGFSNLTHLATGMFTSGIPSVTIPRMLHEHLKHFYQSLKN